MSEGFLRTMLDALTSGYSRKDLRNAYHSLPMDTNIGRLFSTFDFGLKIIQEQTEKMRLWDDIDNARGAVLDRYAANFGVKRNGSPDPFLRLLIKVKMISLLSGGDIDTVIKAAASLFDIPPENVELREVFPAKVWIYIDEALLDAARLDTAEIIAQMMKRIVAAGVGTRLIFRTYRRYQNSAVINTACTEYAEITLRPANPNRTFKRTAQMNQATYEYAEITIRPAN